MRIPKSAQLTKTHSSIVLGIHLKNFQGLLKSSKGEYPRKFSAKKNVDSGDIFNIGQRGGRQREGRRKGRRGRKLVFWIT
jgi:hypothetical protein